MQTLELGPFATTHTYELSGFSVPDQLGGFHPPNPHSDLKKFIGSLTIVIVSE
jgi:hypothetical protein